jgi:inosine triphosphate pyrophosphatase
MAIPLYTELMNDKLTTAPIITLVTGNPNKLRELTDLAPDSLNFSSAAVELEEIQSLDLQAILEHKLRQAYAEVGSPVIAEDVSAELASLNGLPGPFIKFFGQRLGSGALYTLSKVANDRVAIRCLAGYYDGQKLLFGEGVLRGTITAPRGENGFGFDPVVVPDNQPAGAQRTVAEMTAEEKNAISHRGQAFRNLLRQLSS